MSPNSLDLRIQRTLQRIQQTFLAMLETQPFVQITVSDLCARAQINRATFYRHYTDIYDLAQQIMQEIDALQLLQQRKTEDHVSAVRAIFEHVAEYASFYRAMMRPGGLPGFRAHMEATIADQLRMSLPVFGFDPKRATMPPSLVIRYLAAAQLAFVQWWMEEGMPFSAEEAALYLIRLHTAGCWQALGLGTYTPAQKLPHSADHFRNEALEGMMGGGDQGLGTGDRVDLLKSPNRSIS